MISAAAEVQRRLWGTDPQAWAELAESHNRPLFEAVLDAAAVGPGTAVLDVGCGSGLTLVLAQQRGAVPSGVDISPGLLGIARDRLPRADLRVADMESLPFGDAAFDAVTGVNAFQFAGDPRRALREAARVTRPGGHVVASLFAAPERSQGTVAHEAMSALIPPRRVITRPMRSRRPATSRLRWPTQACSRPAAARSCASGGTRTWTRPSAPCSARRAAPAPPRRPARKPSARPCGQRSPSSRPPGPAPSPCGTPSGG